MAYSAVTGRMWPKFNSLKIVCVSLLPASLKRIGTMQPRKSGYIVFRRSSAANSVVSSRTLRKFELIQAIFKACSFHVQVPKGENGDTIFPVKSLWRFFSDAQGQPTL